MSDRLTFKPVTDKTVGDFEKLFSAKGSPNYCWCMAWRATPDEIKNSSRPLRKKQMLGRIADGVQVGLLAYEEGEPIGWISLAPKENFRKLGGVEEGDGVWSLTCMFVPRARRGEGLANDFIKGAATYVKKQGGKLLEAYPVDPDSPSYRYMGFVPAFERAGFAETGREGKRRHVMQLSL
ncbi:GNAT family N-acetyltransferase [Devosia riboflavina]